MGFDCFKGRERSGWGLTVLKDEKEEGGFDCFIGRERRGWDLTVLKDEKEEGGI